jgi:ribulose-phosphate 3-epimerase
MKQKIVPAIIAKSQIELDEMLEKCVGKVDTVMLDVMDGRFVVNTSLYFDFSLKDGLEYEAHLMVLNPWDFLEKMYDKVQTIIFHVETLENISAAMNAVRAKGLKLMLALKPETDVDVVKSYLNKVDGVLVMTVIPGKYGSRFLPGTLEKVKTIRKMDEKINIEVDGGMNPKNVRAAGEAGANIFASGSFLLKSDDFDLALSELKKAASIVRARESHARSKNRFFALSN